MEIFPNSRAQSPACSRAPRAVGELRLQDILRALLFSLLSVLLGRRHAAHPLALPACDTSWDGWINLPESDSELALDDILACELPLQLRRLLYLFGTRRNRGMHSLSRAIPLLCARIARGPPVPEIPLHTPQSAPNHPKLGTMTHAYRSPTAQSPKSFLVLFFKKEPLPYAFFSQPLAPCCQ